MGQQTHGQEVINFWDDDGWRAPSPRAQAESVSEAEIIPFDSVRAKAVEAARAGVADFFAPMSSEQAQVTMNDRADRDDL